MAEVTEISWCDHTFNPWWGCSKISPACDNCYAERTAQFRQPTKVLWGVSAERREFGDKHWDEPRTWNKQAIRERRRHRVFCASMADVFDKNAPDGGRERLWKLIEETPCLDWLLLTKRVGNAAWMRPDRWEHRWPDNIWLGSTVVNQEEVERDVPKLLEVPVRLRFLSVEPMLGPVTVWHHLLGGIHWVIAGGESGAQARTVRPEWVRDLRDQCRTAAVPFHFKQWGEWAPAAEDSPVDKRLAGDMYRFGKKLAGRRVDGVEHLAFPN